jgi:bifunctional DNA-binding transcriptional regulator/antitoxin component of YhaV-PrlF toxin-antitoxin module
MRTWEVPVDPDGSVVIPPEMRDLLGMDERSRVRFSLDGSGVRMSVVYYSPYTLDEVVGSIPGRPGMSVDFDDEIEEAMADALAEKHGLGANR